MIEADPPSYGLLCSGCYTPCAGADSHVVPRWNPHVRRILTSYRCGNCWLPALAETRAAVTSGVTEVRMSFCDFLDRHGYSKQAATIRAASAAEQETVLLGILDAVEAGQLTFLP